MCVCICCVFVVKFVAFFPGTEKNENGNKFDLGLWKMLYVRWPNKCFTHSLSLSPSHSFYVSSNQYPFYAIFIFAYILY